VKLTDGSVKKPATKRGFKKKRVKGKKPKTKAPVVKTGRQKTANASRTQAVALEPIDVVAQFKGDRLIISWSRISGSRARVRIRAANSGGVVVHSARADASVGLTIFGKASSDIATVEVRATSEGRVVAMGSASRPTRV
jgi:hypothetical protein